MADYKCKKCGKELYLDEVEVLGRAKKMKVYRCGCGFMYLTGNFIREVLP